MVPWASKYHDIYLLSWETNGLPNNQEPLMILLSKALHPEEKFDLLFETL